MYKKLYSRFLAAHPTELHFACHSHHYWPDVTREAHIEYWDDSCKYVDKKWEHFFSDKIPRAQKLIAENLHLSHPDQIVFAPNTHEFVFRLLSALNWNQKVRILTTDSEFYSFDRQINRLAEFPNFEIVKIPTQPFATFEDRFEKALKSSTWDLVFLSQVFFNSGVVCDVVRLAKAADNKTTFVIDGYHAFMAVPTDLSSIQDRAFYLAGSYKYAQGGEGACFLYVPPSTRHRPAYTGWFAELSHLTNVGNQVGYPEDALQYAGSTMDFSAVYRLVAVLEKFKAEGLSVLKIHAHVKALQDHFVQELAKANSSLIQKKNLLSGSSQHHGHFLTFELPSMEKTIAVGKDLEKHGLQTDSRSNRLRFGFGLHQEKADVEKAINLIAKT
jgi:selenocysteine lyase/cysteine desulfurase